MNSKFEEMESLLFDWASGTLDDNGVRRLRAMLREDEEARMFFVQQQMLSTALKLEADAGLELSDRQPLHHSTMSSTKREQNNPAKRLSRLSVWAMTSSLLLIFLLTGRVFYLEFSNKSSTAVITDTVESEPTSQGVALVTRLVDVSWEADQKQVSVGDALLPGRFAFASGFAQIEFFCGATVIVEGPADLELDSPMLARVRNGRLRAQVPPAARGFSLEVNDLKVVDLGTEFGLSVTPSGTDVQVFDGEIELHTPTSTMKTLTTGQGVARATGGQFEEINVEPEKFLNISNLGDREQQKQKAQYRQWQTWSQNLRQDPRLIAYYSFAEEGDWERRLACSKVPHTSEFDGAIVGAREVPGRWPAKRALEFKQPADRVRVQIPGEFDSLTFAAWVKIDSLDRWYNSLFLTDGYDQNEPHWQILENGQLYFSIRPENTGTAGSKDFKALSPSFWSPTMAGKWIHLAVTCDLQTNTIIHYLNGEVLSRHLVPAEQMPQMSQIGTASIGNWSSPTLPGQRFAIRNLNGAIDELAIFKVALSAKEIKEIFNHGNL
ncbi:MAG TPA: iron dicitrate transport regulator FecR [Planctomycetaceae bacterium]|nr:iron dicitrate transport regulator FecR [Planctomycetaceae bacterium]